MIVTIPSKVLTTSAKRVSKIDKKIRQIIADMKKTLLACNHPKGVGLAASQIGFPLQIFVTKSTEESSIEVFINPVITWKDPTLVEIQRPQASKSTPHKEHKLEGCLSIPNIWGYLKRPKAVRLRYMDIHGVIHEKEFSGFMATIIQHEVDHLSGILFTQRVLEQKEKLYEIEEDEEGKEKLVEIEI